MLCRHLISSLRRCLSTAAAARPAVRIIEVGPRDGLQNEKSLVSAAVKIELIEKLVKAGMMNVESGSFVSPKWVPQMGSTMDVHTSSNLRALRDRHGDALNFPILVPNARGLKSFLELRNNDTAPNAKTHPISNEIAVFVAATEAFSKANLNCTVDECLAQLVPVVRAALEQGIKVRGYVSVVVGCPFEGYVDPEASAKVARELLKMGCYEISLGDTLGVGHPDSWEKLIRVLKKDMPVDVLAAHCHDSFGTGIACILSVVESGIRVFDSSISGLGGCPYSPGATGNVATEDVVYALESQGYSTGVLPLPAPSATWDDLLVPGSARSQAFEELALVGDWISKSIGRPNGSRAGIAALAKKARREAMAKL